MNILFAVDKPWAEWTGWFERCGGEVVSGGCRGPRGGGARRRRRGAGGRAGRRCVATASSTASRRGPGRDPLRWGGRMRRPLHPTAQPPV